MIWEDAQHNCKQCFESFQGLIRLRFEVFKRIWHAAWNSKKLLFSWRMSEGIGFTEVVEMAAAKEKPTEPMIWQATQSSLSEENYWFKFELHVKIAISLNPILSTENHWNILKPKKDDASPCERAHCWISALRFPPGKNSPMAKSAWYPLLCPTILDGDRPSNDCLVVANCGGSPLVIVSCIRVRIFFGQQPLGKAFWNHSRTSRNRSCCTKIWSFGDKVQHTPVKWWWGRQCSFWHWSRDSRGISPPKKLGLNEPNKNSHGKGRQQPSKQYRKWSPLWHQNTSSQAGHSSFIYSGCGRVGKPDKFPSTLFNDPNLLHRYSWTTEFSSLGHVIIDLTCQEEAPRFQHLLAL